MTFARRFLSSLSHSQNLSFLVEAGNIAHLFRDAEKADYQAVREHVTKYGKIPSPATLATILDEPVLEQAEPPGFYLDLMIEQHVELSVKRAMQRANEIFADAGKTPTDALEMMVQACGGLIVENMGSKIVDMREAGAAIWTEYARTLAGSDDDVFTGWPTLDTMLAGLRVTDLISIIGRPGAGKAQPLSSAVLTPKGFVRMGDIKVGDELASVDGAPSEVRAVHPQGVRPVYRVTFVDGRSTLASDEHLWRVYNRHCPEKWQIKTTVQIQSMLKAKRYQGRLSVELFEGDFGEPLPKGFLTPWLLGILIGDGCFKTDLSLASADPEIPVRVGKELPPFAYVTHRSKHEFDICGCNYGASTGSWGTNPVTQNLKRLGLWNHGSLIKFLPDQYLKATRAERWEFLRGLMDSDGHVGKNGNLSFCSSSEKLARQFQTLVWSLGGVCKIRRKKTKCADTFILAMRFNNPEKAVWLPRKKLRTMNYQYEGGVRNKIASVEYVGDEECQCIEVTHPSRLYVTDDFIVTHNSWTAVFVAHYVWRMLKRPVLFVSMEMDRLQMQQRFASLYSKVPFGDLKRAELTSVGQQMLKTALIEMEGLPFPLWIVDGHLTSTVDDIATLAIQRKPALVILDGAYLMRHAKETDIYKRVAMTTEQIKRDVAKVCPVIATYQFSRESTKKKDAASVGLEDIAYSDVIGQMSSLVLGLLEPKMAENEIVSDPKKKVYILKGRNGEIGSFDINWRFAPQMNFGEGSVEHQKVPLFKFAV